MKKDLTRHICIVRDVPPSPGDEQREEFRVYDGRAFVEIKDTNTTTDDFMTEAVSQCILNEVLIDRANQNGNLAFDYALLTEGLEQMLGQDLEDSLVAGQHHDTTLDEMAEKLELEKLDLDYAEICKILGYGTLKPDIVILSPVQIEVVLANLGKEAKKNEPRVAKSLTEVEKILREIPNQR